MNHSSASLARPTPREVASLCLSCVLLAATSIAHADLTEELVQVAHHPTDPDTLLMRYRNGGQGLMLTHDGGKTMQLIAGSFIDPLGGVSDGVAAVANDGTLFLGASGGTYKSGPDGCSFTHDEQVGERWMRDFANDPDEPELLYALAGNTGPDVENGLMVRDGDGQWSELGVQEKLLMYSMQMAKTDSGLRFVVTTRRDEPGEDDDGNEITVTSFAFRISDDRGESWQERAFEGLSPRGDEAPEIVSIDPSDPDHMVFFIDGIAEDRLLVTLDGGESVEPYMTVRDFSGAAILPDGQVVIGDRGSLMEDDSRGIWSAPSLADEPVLLDAWQVRCVDYDARTDVLLGCELRGLGPIDRETGVFEVGTRLVEVQGLSCPGIDVARASQVQLCGSFCGSHYPQAPVCEAYQMPGCGPCAAIPPTPLCTLYAQPEDAGSPAGSTDAGEVNADGGSELAEDAGQAMPDGGGGGCACRALGHGPRPAASGVGQVACALAFGATVAARRTRKRRPR